MGDRTNFSYHGYGKYCSYTHPVKIKKKWMDQGNKNLQYTEWYSLYIIFTSFKLYRVHSYVRFDHSCISPLIIHVIKAAGILTWSYYTIFLDSIVLENTDLALLERFLRPMNLNIANYCIKYWRIIETSLLRTESLA